MNSSHLTSITMSLFFYVDLAKSILALVTALTLVACEKWEGTPLSFPVPEGNEMVDSIGPAYIYRFQGKLTGLTPETEVSAYGHVWSDETIAAPTLESNLDFSRFGPISGNLDTIFSLTGEQLCPETKYYFRSYSIIANEIHYSQVHSFTTAPVRFNYAIGDSEISFDSINNQKTIRLAHEFKGYPRGLEVSKIGYTVSKVCKEIEAPIHILSESEEGKENQFPETFNRAETMSFFYPGDYYFEPFIENCGEKIYGKKEVISVKLPWFRLSECDGYMEPTPRYDAASFFIDSIGYLVAGVGDNNNLSDFYHYDTRNDQWLKSEHDFEGGQLVDAVGFSLNNKGYIVTGEIKEGINSFLTNKCWEYDPDADDWKEKDSFPGLPRKGAVSFTIDDKAYVGLGRDNSGAPLNDFWVFDPTAGNSGAWDTLRAALPGAARFDAVGFSIGGKGYIGTGRDNNTVWKDFWIYDTISKRWDPLEGEGIFPGKERFNAIGFSVGNKGYVGKGKATSGFWEYDPSNGIWRSITEYNPENGRESPVWFTSEDKAYIGMGIVAGNLQDDFWIFDPEGY